jgi:hypothetical protein
MIMSKLTNANIIAMFVFREYGSFIAPANFVAGACGLFISVDMYATAPLFYGFTGALSVLLVIATIALIVYTETHSTRKSNELSIVRRTGIADNLVNRIAADPHLVSAIADYWAKRYPNDDGWLSIEYHSNELKRRLALQKKIHSLSTRANAHWVAALILIDVSAEDITHHDPKALVDAWLSGVPSRAVGKSVEYGFDGDIAGSFFSLGHRGLAIA